VPCDCLRFPDVLLRITVYNLPLNDALETSQVRAAFPPAVKGLWGILEASCGRGARGGCGGLLGRGLSPCPSETPSSACRTLRWGGSFEVEEVELGLQGVSWG